MDDKNPEVEVEKAKARLDTAEEMLRFAKGHVAQLEGRCDFYREEFRRILKNAFVKVGK